VPSEKSRRTRLFFRSQRLLILAVAFCWVADRAVRYPFDYLFELDREIWIAQIGTWLVIFGEAALFGVAAACSVEAIRRGLAKVRLPGGTGEWAERVESLLRGKLAPLAVAALTFVVAAYAQGPLESVTTGPNEAAYLMQAKLLAAGHWRAAAAPIPEFFEQMYVFVWPFTAAKYPPGFPFALVPGIWLGAPFLVPAVLVGVTAGFMFALGRQLAGPWVALVASILWITNPHGEAPLQRMMSEHLSTMLVVASWWALARWHRSARMRDLVVVAAFVGWGAITRPLTMLAMAIPIGVVVIRRTVRTRKWGQLAAASAAGLAILLVLPLWSHETTGDWRVAPLALHVRWYTPYDALGFGTPPAPLRALPPDLDRVRITLYRSRLGHRWADIPRLVVERAFAIAHDAFPGWRVAFLPFLIGALFLSRPDVTFAAISASVDFVAYLSLSHPSHLTKYYLETYPALFFIAGIGVWAMLFGRIASEPAEGKTSDAGTVAGLPLVVVLIATGIGSVGRLRADRIAEAAPKMHFAREIAGIPATKAVVFVRYGPRHLSYASLIENDADLSSERVWMVYDRGADNARLRAVAPDRIPYLYDEAGDRLIRLDRPLDDRERAIVGPSAATITAPSSERPTSLPDTRKHPDSAGFS